MQFWIHLALAVLGIAYFLYSYIKERKIYQLLFVIWIPLTLLTYLSKNKIYLLVLGIVQLAFFFLVIYFLFRNPNKKKGTYQSMLEQLDSYGKETEQPQDTESAEEAAEAAEAEPAADAAVAAEAAELSEEEPETSEKEQE